VPGMTPEKTGSCGIQQMFYYLMVCVKHTRPRDRRHATDSCCLLFLSKLIQLQR
jgi:hypothetical protein